MPTPLDPHDETCTPAEAESFDAAAEKIIAAMQARGARTLAELFDTTQGKDNQ